MNKLKEMLIDKKFYLFMMIVIIFFGMFFKLEYATDTYTVFENSTKVTVEHFFTSGRFVTGICQMIVRLLHFGNTFTYLLSFVLAIICLSISIYKLFKIFIKDINNTCISMLISVLILINVFSIELFLYIEKGIMLFSVLLNVLAFEQLTKYLKEQNRKSLVLVFIYMIIANFSYQGTVALFVVLSIIYILKYSKDVKSFIKNNIVTALCYGIPAFINYAIVKFIFINNRIAGEFNLNLTIKNIIFGTKQMLLTYSIIPKYLFITIIGVLLVTILYYIIKYEKTKKEKLLSFLAICYIIIGSFITTILPQFMQASESIWFVPRSSYAFAGIIGILILYLFITYKVNMKLEKIILITMIIYLIVQYISFQTIIQDHYIVNYLDEYQALQIKEQINQYEESTGEIVTKVAFYENESGGNWTYPNIKAIGDINVKALYPNWSRIPYLKHYLGKTFKEIEKDNKIYEQYFIDKQWNSYSKEQVIIKKDTLHLYVY